MKNTESQESNESQSEQPKSGVPKDISAPPLVVSNEGFSPKLPKSDDYPKGLSFDG
ncbi:hypothetical protein [Stenotrophomonas sp. PSU_St99]